MTFYVKISDAIGDIWHEFNTKIECLNYAELIDGIPYESAKDNVRQEIIDNAVQRYMTKQKKHVVV